MTTQYAEHDFAESEPSALPQLDGPLMPDWTAPAPAEPEEPVEPMSLVGRFMIGVGMAISAGGVAWAIWLGIAALR